jgi:hypothetical protein
MIGKISQESLMKLRDWKLKFKKVVLVSVKEVRRGGGGFLLRFGWCRGSARKRMLSFGFLFFRHQTRAKSRTIEGRLSQERYKVSRIGQAEL